MLRCSSLAAGALIAASVCAAAGAQCDPSWQSISTYPGADAPVHALAEWDPDGPGPLGPRVALGGTFSVAGGARSRCVAAWDPAIGQWTALPGVPGVLHVDPQVRCLAALPNGDLLAGGLVNGGVLRWNGVNWQLLGSGIPTSASATSGAVVQALAVLSNGDVVAAGRFATAGGVGVNNVARWNGTTWSSLGSGLQGAPGTTHVAALAVLPNGDLVAAGAFSTSGGTAVANVARWNGTQWLPLGSGANQRVAALAVMPSGDLVAGGAFTTAGGVPASRLARWNGSAWSQFAGGVNNTVVALAVGPTGDLACSGGFDTVGGTVLAPGLARWDGARWSAFGAGNANGVAALLGRVTGDWIVGGSFAAIGGLSARNLARWNHGIWRGIGDGLDGRVQAFANAANGDLIAGGDPTVAGGAPAGGIARWDGFAWHTLLGGTNGSVSAVAGMPNGDVVAGGSFTLAGGVPAAGIARWNGGSWSPLGAGIDGSPYAIVPVAGGALVVGGQLTAAGDTAVANIAHWDGTSWSEPGGGVSGEVAALAALSNGDLLAAGAFQFAGGVPANRIARWNGSAWSAVGSGFDGPVTDLLVLANGDVLAAGTFTTAGGIAAPAIARWNGSAWSALPAAVLLPVSLRWLAELPNGDVVAGGRFTINTYTFDGTARHDGYGWVTLAQQGFTWGIGRPGGGVALAGGRMTSTFAWIDPHITELATTCPAIAQPVGAGCSGSGGVNVLAAESLPWIGTTFRSRASGLVANTLAVEVVGLGALGVPLPTLLPQGGPGCVLHVTPDVLLAHVSTGGVLALQLPLPNVLALVGQSLRQQVLPLELAGGGGVLALTATNALLLTIGHL